MIFLRILKTLFGIYAMILFVATLLIVTIFYSLVFLLIPQKTAPYIAHRIISRVWAKVLTTIFFVPAKIKNKEFLDPTKTYVIVANHQSQLDIPVYALASKNTFRFLAKAELTKIPLMGFIIKNLYMSVNRGDRADRNRSIEIMKKSLDEGISVFLCPEGTRNRNQEPPLLPFHDGAFRLAILTQTPMAVLTLLNSGKKLSPNHPIELTPGRIYAVWDRPIETVGLTMEDLPALKEQVHEMMAGRLNEWRTRKNS